jgi:hypothetical protein
MNWAQQLSIYGCNLIPNVTLQLLFLCEGASCMCIVTNVPIQRNTGSSGDGEGHGMSPKRGITRWKRLRTSSVHCRSVCAVLPTVLLEVDIIGTHSKCCQLRKHEVLQHHYVTFRRNCNSSAAFITPNCYSYDAAELLQLLQNCYSRCRTVTVAAELSHLLQNSYGRCITVTVAAELLRLLKNWYGCCRTGTVAAELLQSLQNCNGCCRTATAAAQLLRLLKNWYGCCRTVTASAQLLRLLKNWYGCCRTVTVVAKLLQSPQNWYGCCRTVTVVAKLLQSPQNCYSRCRTVTVAGDVTVYLSCPTLVAKILKLVLSTDPSQGIYRIRSRSVRLYSSRLYNRVLYN